MQKWRWWWTQRITFIVIITITQGLVRRMDWTASKRTGLIKFRDPRSNVSPIGVMETLCVGVLKERKKQRNKLQGWKLQFFITCPSDKCWKNLPVRRAFNISFRKSYNLICLSENWYVSICSCSFLGTCPSDNQTYFSHVRHKFYLSRTVGQSIISIPVSVNHQNSRFLKMLARWSLANIMIWY